MADEKDLLDAQLGVFLDPDDPEVRRQAETDGIPADWIDAARRSPVYALAMRHRVALPLHPEYRTLPMVWYVPPLSPVMGMIEGEGSTADPDDVFPAIDRLRIPVRYLSNLLARGRRRGDPPGAQAARRDAALHARAVAGRRGRRLGGAPRSGMEVGDMEDMYRLLALAKYDERFVIPTAHAELAGPLSAQQGACGLDFAGGPGGCGANGRADRAEEAGEAFHLHPAPAPAEPVAAPVGARPWRPPRAAAAAGPAPAAGRRRREPVRAHLARPAAPRRRAAGGPRATSPARPARCPPRRRRTPCAPSSPGGRASPAAALARRYVETFDLSRRTALDLTYYTHGDRRQRGLALLALRRRYAESGLELEGPELPDHLPVMLEYAALDPVGGRRPAGRVPPGARAGADGARARREPLRGAPRRALPDAARAAAGRARGAAAPGARGPARGVGGPRALRPARGDARAGPPRPRRVRRRRSREAAR